MIEKWRVVYNTLRPRSSPLGAAKSNFTAYGCDVDSLCETGTKTRAGHDRRRRPHFIADRYQRVRTSHAQRAESWLTNLGCP